MHQTTIRFGSDLWESLAVAASTEGVSVAQYVRESAVARLVREGTADAAPPVAQTDRRRDARAPRQGAPADLAEPFRPIARGPETERRAFLLARVADGERAAARNTESSAAVWAQSRLARARSRELRAASRALTAGRRAGRPEAARSSADLAGPGPEDAAPRARGARA